MQDAFDDRWGRWDPLISEFEQFQAFFGLREQIIVQKCTQALPESQRPIFLEYFISPLVFCVLNRVQIMPNRVSEIMDSHFLYNLDPYGFMFEQTVDDADQSKFVCVVLDSILIYNLSKRRGDPL